MQKGILDITLKINIHGHKVKGLLLKGICSRTGNGLGKVSELGIKVDFRTLKSREI